MERYEEGALRSDAAYVRQRHLCVHCLIGLRFMELEKRKPCLYQQRVLREIILSIRCTHTRCRGENTARRARSAREEAGESRFRVCTTGGVGRRARRAALIAGVLGHAPARGRRADRASHGCLLNLVKFVAAFFEFFRVFTARAGRGRGEAKAAAEARGEDRGSGSRSSLDAARRGTRGSAAPAGRAHARRCGALPPCRVERRSRCRLRADEQGRRVKPG